MSGWHAGDDEGEQPLIVGTCSHSALDQLFRTEAPRLTQYFRRRIGNGDDAVDLVQEAFLRLAGAQPMEGLRNPKAYLQRIARNLLFNRSKRAEQKLVATQLPVGADREIAVAPDQSHAIEANDLIRLYRRAVDSLTPRTREVFLLHRVDELSYKEIAARLEISVSTVQYHMVNALLHISQILEQE